MDNARYRSKQVKFYVTDEEFCKLKKRAKNNGMSVGKYLRETAIHASGKPVPVIDVAPLRSIDHELKKQGTNLNQLMYFLNSYGIHDYNEKEVTRVLGLKGDAYVRLSNALGDLRDEAERHHVRILDSDDMDDEDGL